MIKLPDYKTIANMLFQAEVSKESIELAGETEYVCDYYRVQEEYVNLKIMEENSSVIGYKVSLTDVELQSVFKSDSPVYGTLLSSNMLAEGASLQLTSLLDPLLEVELIFKLTETLSDNPEEAEIIRKTVVAPGFEIPDSRIKNWFPHISINELISDNAVTGKVVVGTFVQLNEYISWHDLKAELFLNGQFVSNGHSSKVLSNPLHSIKWLQQSLVKAGKTLHKGMVVSSGTFIKPVKLERGTYKAEFDNFGYLTLHVL